MQLGLALQDFRNLPEPDGKAGRVVCTGDSVTENGRAAILYDLDVSKVEAALGVKKCVWWGKVYSSLPEQEVSLSLPSDGYAIGEYSFEFIKDPKDGVVKFYKFFGTSHSNANTDIVSALTNKFGPAHERTEMLQNDRGASFQSKISTWANAASILVVKERWMSINKLAIMLTDNRLLQIEIDAETAEKSKMKNPI